MKRRTIAGRAVFPIDLGAMALDEYKPAASDKDSFDLLRHAVKQGVELIDTADVYGLGRNEELIGKALTAEQKQSVIIATKVGCTRPDGISWGTDGRPEHIKKAVHESLKRLGVKQIELYQLHAPDRSVPLKDSVRALKELQNQKMVKHIGLSNVTIGELKEAQQIVSIVSVQNRYNLSYHWNDDQELLPYLTEQKIAYLPYFPLGSGRLLQHLPLVKLAEKLRITESQLCLAWILNKWSIAIPIPGTKNPAHLDENMKVADVELPESIIKELDGMF